MSRLFHRGGRVTPEPPTYEARYHRTLEKHAPDEAYTYQVRKVTPTLTGPSITNFPAGRARSWIDAKRKVKEFVEHQQEMDSHPWEDVE